MPMTGPEFDLIAHAIPGDHSRNSSAQAMLAHAATLAPANPFVLDLGCGDGRAVDLIHAVLPQARYLGIDIEASPEVASRRRDDAEFVVFDGVNIPLADASVNIVYSSQVFEHVRHQDRLMAEIRRVLAPGGRLVGSMSGLEPYHSFSMFNLTPYGVFRLVEDNGLQLEMMRPGVDGLALIFRQLSLRRINNLPISYAGIGLLAKWRRLEARRVNYLKLRMAGHICISAVKAD